MVDNLKCHAIRYRNKRKDFERLKWIFFSCQCIFWSFGPAKSKFDVPFLSAVTGDLNPEKQILLMD